jgi:hypothetical protein
MIFLDTDEVIIFLDHSSGWCKEDELYQHTAVVYVQCNNYMAQIVSVYEKSHIFQLKDAILMLIFIMQLL